MATQDLVIYQKVVDLTTYLFPALNHFPKQQRFVLGQQIQNQLLVLATSVIEANKAKDKAAVLDRMDTELEQLRYMIRIAAQMKFMKSQCYEQAAKQISEIGRLLGGWRRRFG